MVLINRGYTRSSLGDFGKIIPCTLQAIIYAYQRRSLQQYLTTTLKLCPTVNDNKTEDGSDTGSFTSTITGLEPNTNYYVRAYAINSTDGNTFSFTTYKSGYGSFTDPRDDNVYQTVTIGNQIWMAENLRYLPSVVPSATSSPTLPYYYVYSYD